MMSDSRNHTITLRGSGVGGVVVVLAITGFALVALPRLLSPAPSAAEAIGAIRELQKRQVSQTFLPGVRSPDPDSARSAVRDMAGALSEIGRTTFSDIGVRRSWVGPPFARRWAFAVRVRESGSQGWSYYRLSRQFASDASLSFWRFPLF